MKTLSVVIVLAASLSASFASAQESQACSPKSARAAVIKHFREVNKGIKLQYAPTLATAFDGGVPSNATTHYLVNLVINVPGQASNKLAIQTYVVSAEGCGIEEMQYNVLNRQ